MYLTFYIYIGHSYAVFSCSANEAFECLAYLDNEAFYLNPAPAFTQNTGVSVCDV